MNEYSINEKIYTDESIPAAKRPVFIVPSIIKEARKLEKDVWGNSNSNIFVQQAKLLENYEDDYVYSKKSVHYFPTYRDFSDQELRGYFGWRTRLRHGNLEKSNSSFASVYCYELINQIGVSSALDGYNKLVWFRNEYSKLDNSLNHFLNSWIRDYVVYNNLSNDLLVDDSIVKLDNALFDLFEMKKSNEELFYALYELCIDGKTELLIEDCDDLKALQNISVNIIKKLVEYFKQHRKQGFWNSLFGEKWIEKWIELFKSAMFYDIKKKEKYNCKYQIDNLRCYECRNGIWLVSGYSYNDSSRRHLTVILLSIKSLISEYLGKKNEPCLYSKQWFIKIAKKEISEYFKREEQKKSSEISIDFSKLNSIRNDAAITCDKLVTEEEKEDSASEKSNANDYVASISNNLSEINNEISTNSELVAQSNNNDFTEDETFFIKCLINKQDYSELTRKGTMITVLVDSINEKLFDMIGDTVIEFEDKPVIVNDYVEELKSIVKYE